MFSKQLFRHWTYRIFAPGALLRERYEAFQRLLKFDDVSLTLMAELEDVAYGGAAADAARVAWLARRLIRAVSRMAAELSRLHPARYVDLPEYLRKIEFYIRLGLDEPGPEAGPPYVLPLAEALGRPLAAGGKAVNLAVAKVESGLSVPPAAVATSNAMAYFLEANGLGPRLDKRLRRISLGDPAALAQLCGEMQGLVLGAEVPEPVAGEILFAARALAGDGGRLAVRSSAVGEDGAASFAGQFESELNVAPDQVLAAYKKVLAAKYSPRAVTYRILAGLSDAETPMAAILMPMVKARAAGVIYTHNPPGESCVECLAAYAVAGTGERLVGGGRTPQTYRFSRDPDPQATEAPVPAAAVLERSAAASLARAGLALERLFGRPQDIEWALDQRGRIQILQCRPIPAGNVCAAPRGEAEPDAPLLLWNLVRAADGVACGEVVHASGPVDPADIPQGAVLVTRTLSPELTRVLGRAGAVVSAAGSRASHFASVAREMGLPVLVAEPDVFAKLPQGRIVTVDARLGRIYAGRVESLLGAPGRRALRPGPARERLDKVLPHIAKLSFTDPASPSFAPENVRSLHDVVRFCHEKAVAEMFTLVDRGGAGLSRAKRLKSQLPMSMYVLDLGDGLFEAAASRSEVTPNDFKSSALWAFWYGLADPAVAWDAGMMHVDWEALERLSTGGGMVSKDSRLLSSYAVASANYLHLSLRFGYHFSVVDAYCGPDAAKNYAALRFKGGGGSVEGRRLRLEFIAQVLGPLGFALDFRGDMLDARAARRDEAETQKLLALLGGLLAETRLMDMRLSDPAQVSALARDFLARRRGVAGDEL